MKNSSSVEIKKDLPSLSGVRRLLTISELSLLAMVLSIRSTSSGLRLSFSKETVYFILTLLLELIVTQP